MSSDDAFSALSCIMTMDVVRDGTDVIGQLFGERESLAHQATAPLAYGVVETLDMIGLTAVFANQRHFCDVTDVVLGWVGYKLPSPGLEAMQRV